MPRRVPHVGMEALIEELATRQRVVVVDVQEGGRRVLVERDGRPVAFTLRELTGKYVEETEPYYGPRLRLLG